VYLTDTESRIIFANAALHTVTGYSVEDVLGRPSAFLRSDADRHRVTEYLEAVKRGTDWTGELLNVCADGREYPVEATISPIFDSNGALIGHAAIERDISSKKRLQIELERERKYALSILNSLDAAIYTVDRQFRLSHVNDGWRKMPEHHGWLTITQPPVVGLSLLELVVDPERRAELNYLFESVLAKGEPHHMEVTDAEKRCWNIKISPWQQGSEKLGLIYSVIEHTKIHELQRQLFQAQKMETIGALAAGVAHDFNNLLQAIRGNVTLLQLQASLADPHKARLNRIDEAAARAADITQQLLSFSRPADDKDSVVDMNHIIEEVSHLAHRSLRNNVAIVLEPYSGQIMARLDASRAQQVFLNLCVNAIDAMPEGGQIILKNDLVELTAEQAAKGHQVEGAVFACCSVIDNGTGIPPEIMSRIFDPFFTTKEQGKGTGLGLAIVHNITAHCGGFVEIDTAVGRGTTFRVFLPATQPGSSRSLPAVSPDLSKGTGRILVVDDLVLVLEFARNFLIAAGYEVLTATSAEDAIHVLESETKPVDLLFTDFNMKGKSGLQLIDEVSVRWPDVKFILASGYLEQNERRQIEMSYNAHVLGKPYNVREATNLIADILGR
jgi:PAS domain S-box-containing protein